MATMTRKDALRELRTAFTAARCPACAGSGRVSSPVGVGRILRRLRGDVSLRRVAVVLGLSAPYVSDLERGRRNVSREMAMRYLKAVEKANEARMGRAHGEGEGSPKGEAR